MTVIDQVKNAIRAQIGKPRLVIADDADMTADLGMDSLDVVETVTALDNLYDLDPDLWEPFFAAADTAAVISGHWGLTPQKFATFIARLIDADRA